MDSLFPIQKVYTVLELNSEVRAVIKKGFPELIWICGEIQGLRPPDPSKKHIYFELVQKGEEDEGIVARVKVALFAGRQPLIQRRIQEAKGAFELKNDIEVKFLCEVSIHAPSGQYSLVIEDIDTIYTLGKVAQNRLKIIEELKAKGLLEKNKLAVIAALPLKIGLITAYDSAAYHDFTNELTLSGYGFKVLAYNCHMQGALVEKDVLEAMDYFNKLSSSDLDVIVITRGGGSIADLAYFDNKKIAESIANSKFAVITGLGHQINTTIADLVAHTSCKTPTKSAQLLIERITEIVQKLDRLEKDILIKTDDLLQNAKARLQNITVGMDSFVSRYFSLQREEILNKRHSIARALEVCLTQQKETLKNKTAILKSSLPKMFKALYESLTYCQKKVNILDPKRVLERGYSLSYKSGQLFKSIKQVEVGDEITTVVYDGRVESEISRKEKADG